MNEPQAPSVASDALLASGFVAAFFPDCQWCVLTPWIATLDGKPYRAHIADGSTEKEARHIAFQLNRYAKPMEEAWDYAHGNANPANLARESASVDQHSVVQPPNNNS